MKTIKFLILITLSQALCFSSFAQQTHRVGTTAVDFLAIGFGSAGTSMGDAYVSVATDLSAIYWNPAGLSYMSQHEAQFSYQPWIADINTSLTAVGLVVPNIGTFALGLINASYGDMEVTNLTMQDGTGELFNAADYAISLSYARRLAQWFAFGASGKYISSKIWHTTGSAFAIDLGVTVNTRFLSPVNKEGYGLNIAMSISNYGTKLKYDGMDLLQPIDILPDQQGNYRDVAGKFNLQAWELPLIFRIGVSVTPLVTDLHRLTLAIDALHPNNNEESVNIGAQYQLTVPTTGDFYLRGGYKGLYMSQSEYGFSFGGGMVLRLMHNVGLKIDYGYRGMGILGKAHCYTVGVLF
jgi:hypothetical protein